ncbi:MAG TPA: sulfatase-like hydrolase/transferase, partial [Mucilaginibacter sp.]|nr:sulfatase-like hydrolase/transferase [Mucilaginibacter sp.]
MINQQEIKLKVLSVILITAAVLLNRALFAQPVTHTTTDNRPNIIYILTDDMGYSDVGCFGGNFVPTPNIDRLAASGRKFTNFYSAAAICSPSRAGFITGNYPGRWNFSTYLDNRKHNRNAQQADYLDPD